MVLPFKPTDARDDMVGKMDDADARDDMVGKKDETKVLKNAVDGFTDLATKTVPASELVDVEKVQALVKPETLLKTSLLKFDHVRSFALSLAGPLHKDFWADEQAVRGAAQSSSAGFELLNAIGLWIEVFGYYMGFVFGYVSVYGLFDGFYLGSSTFALSFGLVVQLVVALAVSYVLYWSVRCSGAGSTYALGAICVYLAIGGANLFYGIFCLIGGIEPLRFVVYVVKSCVAVCCAYYALKIYRAAEEYVVIDQPTTKMDDTKPPSFPGRPATAKEMH